MKKILRYFLFSLIAIYLVERYIGGVSYSGDYRVLLTATAVLTGAMVIVKPIVKIITLPINLLTLGLFGSLINAMLLYGVTYLVPKFEVLPFTFEGFTYKGFTVPTITMGQIGALIVVSFLLSLVTSILNWLTD